MCWFYRLDLLLDLFGGLALVKEWSRIGAHGRMSSSRQAPIAPAPHAAVLHLLLVILSGMRSDFPRAEGRPWPGHGNGTSVQDAATHRDGPAVGASHYGDARGDGRPDVPDGGAACAR